MAEVVLYVVLFLALYFETFALLTYLGRDARLRRAKTRMEADFPHVAVIVPCFNEESTIRGTIESLLRLDYPQDRLEIILVNDGSTDNTRSVMDAYADHPAISVIHKENGGKHSGLNVGMHQTEATYIGCLDADSFVHPGALREILPHFDNPEVAAVTASMTVHEPKNVLQRMQYAEYLAGVALRHIFAAVNGLYVTPGPFSFYRRDILLAIGGFRHGHQTEDMEMALRLQQNGYKIENAPRAQVYTKAPHTVWGLVKQRTRWTSGFMRNSYDYRALFGNPRYGVLGLMVLPLGVLAIVASLTLVALFVYTSVTGISEFILTQGDVPWSYSFSIPAFDWFYMPITGALLLGLVGIGAAITTMLIGKHISGTRRHIAIDILCYVAIYSYVAPLWLFRSTRDVALGYNRSWR